MPIVTVDAISGRSLEQKRELAKAITQAVVDVYQVPLNSVHVIIKEHSRENLAHAGVLFSDNK